MKEDIQYKRIDTLIRIFKKFGRNRCENNGKRVIQIRLNKLDFILFYVKQNDEVCIAGLAHDKKRIYPEEEVCDYLYKSYNAKLFSIDALEMALMHNS